jgi:hypothetical protein
MSPIRAADPDQKSFAAEDARNLSLDDPRYQRDLGCGNCARNARLQAESRLEHAGCKAPRVTA